MPEIVIATLNAKYIHAAFGIRYLYANLGDLAPRATLAEFDINQRPLDIVEQLLELHPRVLGFGIYIWNASRSLEVVRLLKKIAPEIQIVLGGPEVSHEWENQELVRTADWLITGEADLAFATLCRDLLDGHPPAQRVLHAPLPDLATLALPYPLYLDQDLTHRICYVEASRGCPFHCEFCLSSLDVPVRQFPLDRFLAALQDLLDRGLRHFKFVDRTFNLDLHTSSAILEFFLQRLQPGLFLHFEMIPDRLPAPLRSLIARFPPGTLQFEVGIQSLNPAVCDRISRRQNVERLADNLRFLRTQAQVHVHADLIAGLPGENLASFAAGFDRLVALGPQEIQVGVLKRLRGTPIVRHDADFGMVYAPDPPYELLANRDLDFPTMQRLKRFARFWDLLANSGNFTQTTPLIWHNQPSPFMAFLECSDHLHRRLGQHHAIALPRLLEALFQFLIETRQLPPEPTALTLLADYQKPGRDDVPPCLRPHLPESARAVNRRNRTPRPTLRRQARHTAASDSTPVP